MPKPSRSAIPPSNSDLPRRAGTLLGQDNSGHGLPVTARTNPKPPLHSGDTLEPVRLGCAMAGDELRSFHITTAPFARNGRLDEFLEVFGRAILHLEFDPRDGHALEIDMRVRALPDLAFAAGSCSPMRCRHTHTLATDDDVVLVMLQSGSGELHHRGRVTAVDAGGAILTANGEAGHLTFMSPTGVTNLRLSRRLLAPYVVDLDDMVARPIQRNAPALKLLTSYAAVLHDANELATPALRGLVSSHVYDLAALLLGRKRDAADHAPGVRAARLRAIKQQTLQGIARHELSIDDIAQGQQLSASYIRQLLAADGTTFTDFVLGERLARAHRLLADQRSAARTISAIAYACGFGDLSYFNRTFRRRYGVTPSDVREAARRGRDA
jgi:AraC-like DNA-binding protein